MTGRSAAAFIVMVLTTALWTDATQGAAPTLEELKQLKVVDPPNLTARGKIGEYVKHWTGKMTSAGNVEEVVKARAALTKGYKLHDMASESWQVEYADISASHVPSVLSLPDKVKQLQASMTLATMPQYTIQPALEKMASHRSAAVRYWAARGYQAVARRMLLYEDRSRKMLKTLERLGMKGSGPILSVVLRTLSIYVGKENADSLRTLRDKIWLARCRSLRRGRPGIVNAYRDGVSVLEILDKDDRKPILQLLVDALDSASRAFVKTRNQKDRACKSLTNLLSDLEVKLAVITATGQRPILEILAEPDKKTPIDQKAYRIRRKVNEYWKPLLEKQGVKPRPLPSLRPKPPTTTATATVGK